LLFNPISEQAKPSMHLPPLCAMAHEASSRDHLMISVGE
jgi:hypothetical protein